MFVRIDAPDEKPIEEPIGQLDISEQLEPEPVEVPEVPEETESSEQIEEQPAESEESGEKPLYYSTNSFDRAKSGNSGVFSYKRKGVSYDSYWIISFDENCAYFFTHGNNSSTCERVQIDEGDLNNYILLTYHDGDSSWQYGLCFKRVRQPDRLIQSEADGTQYEYVATDLSEALKLRDQLTIVDY